MAEYIDRDDAVAVIEEKQKELCPAGMFSRHAVYGTDREKFDAWEEIIEQIERIPAADVAPVKRGKWRHRWICSNMSGYEYACSCSVCDKPTYRMSLLEKMPNYCPNCGARMSQEKDDV